MAFTFDGSGYIDTNISTLTNIDNGSLVCWFNSTSTSYGTAFGVSETASTDCFQIQLFRNPTPVEFNNQAVICYMRGAGTSDILDGGIDTGTQLNDGNWHSYVATWEESDNTIDIYVDGVKGTTVYRLGQRNLDRLTFSNYNFAIGALNNFGTITSHYTGQLAHVAIYRGELTADEIASLQYVSPDFLKDTTNGYLEYHWPLVTNTRESVTGTEGDAASGIVLSSDHPPVVQPTTQITFYQPVYYYPNFNNIGAFSQGGLASIGAYEYPLYQEQSNTIGALDGFGMGSTIGAYNQFLANRTTVSFSSVYNESISFVSQLLDTVDATVVVPPVTSPYVSIILNDRIPELRPNMTGLKWAWFDQTVTNTFVTPTDTGTAETTDVLGLLEIQLSGTSLVPGDYGCLALSTSDDVDLGLYRLRVR